MYSIGVCVCRDKDQVLEIKKNIEESFLISDKSDTTKLFIVTPGLFPVIVFYSYDINSLKKPVCIESASHLYVLSGYAFDRKSSATINQDLNFNKELNGDELEGEFVLIGVNKLSGEVTITNDRFASVPFFLFKGQNSLIAASNFHFLKIITKNHISPNELGIFQFLKYSHTLGELTTYKEIEKLLPSTKVFISDGLRAKFSQYWSIQFRPTPIHDLDTFTDEVFRAFKKAVSIREGIFANYTQFNVALSGGLDSRLLIGAMTTSSKLSSFTMGKKGDREVNVASEVAESLGVRHGVFDIENYPLHELVEEALRGNGGLCPIHSVATNNSAYRYLGKGSHLIFGGWPGDVLIGSYIPEEIEYIQPHMKDELLKNFINNRGATVGALSVLYKPEKLKELNELNLDYMRNCFKSIDAPTAAHAISAWSMIYRQPSFSFLSPSHSSTDIAEVTPCLGYEYNDLILSLPDIYLYDKNFYKYLIYKKLEGMRGIQYANTGELLTGKFTNFTKIKKRSSLISNIKKNLPQFIRRFGQIRFLNSNKNPSPYWSYVNDNKVIGQCEKAILNSKIGNQILEKRKVLKFLNSFTSWHANSNKTTLASTVTTLILEEKIVNSSTDNLNN